MKKLLPLLLLLVCCSNENGLDNDDSIDNGDSSASTGLIGTWDITGQQQRGEVIQQPDGSVVTVSSNEFTFNSDGTWEWFFHAEIDIPNRTATAAQQSGLSGTYELSDSQFTLIVTDDDVPDLTGTWEIQGDTLTITFESLQAALLFGQTLILKKQA